MISVREALEYLNAMPWKLGEEQVPLAQAHGRILAEDLLADRDFPPYDRVMMDGIAVGNCSAKAWPLEGRLLAGQAPVRLHDPNAAWEVMTGAVLPQHCQAVLPIECLEFFQQDGQAWVRYQGPAIDPEQFIHGQGKDAKMGDKILSKGQVLNTLAIALAASIGCNHLRVEKRPKIAICPTGDELVAVSEQPEAHQIRSSNAEMMQACLHAKGHQTQVKAMSDDWEALHQGIAQALENCDVLILSGGVSAGKKDLVPKALETAGVTCVFHKIAQKPGKPFWFGHREDGKWVFAFPGNPISTCLCFQVYFLPWLERRKPFNGYLNADFIPSKIQALSQWHPIKNLAQAHGAERLAHHGSGDLISWSGAEALVLVESGEKSLYLPYVTIV